MNCQVALFFVAVLYFASTANTIFLDERSFHSSCFVEELDVFFVLAFQFFLGVAGIHYTFSSIIKSSLLTFLCRLSTIIQLRKRRLLY